MCRSHWSFWGALGAVALLSAAATAEEPLRSPSDLETLCRYSDPVSAEGEDGDATSRRSSYHRDRRRLVQTTYEVVLPSLEVSVLGYDRVTGILSVSGFKDHRLFGGRYLLRFREACGLYFEMDEERARDLVARAQLGGVSLKVGFHLDPHDDYDRPICAREESDPKEGAVQESATVVHVDLLHARLIESDGTVLASFQTELDHDLHLRRVSQAIGAASAATPRVELTSLRERAEEGGEASWPQLERERAWWNHELETSVFPCYIRGLKRNGRLQGAMVVSVPAGAQTPTLILDTVQEEEVAQCVIERVEEVRRRSPEPRNWGPLKATFLLKLD